MDALKTLELRQSAIRKEMTRLATVEMSAEVQVEIDRYGSEYTANETNRIALLVAGDGETRDTHDSARDEYQRMVEGANLGQLLKNISEHHQSDGAIAELQRHHGLASNQIPLVLLQSTPSEIESYAAGLSTIPTNRAQAQSWTLRIFGCQGRGRLRVGDRGAREFLNVWGNCG